MNLDETTAECDLREQVRQWLEDQAPQELRSSREFGDRLACDRVLAAGGYLGFTWPTEFGGRGGSPAMAAILDEECARAGISAAASPSRFGINLLGPTLFAHGTKEQQEFFLPRILTVDDIWCQGFSEPNAGSDLAAVQCRLIRSGSDYRLNGSKIWTTQAREADWCFVLARSTDSQGRHENLSFVLVSMKQPTIEIQSLVQLTGEAEFSQIFFDDAEVRAEHVVGELNGGWKVAITTLSAERSYAQLGRYRAYRAQLQRLVEMIATAPQGLDSTWLYEVGELRAALLGIRNLSFKIASLATAGEDLGSLPSVTKLWWSTVHQRLADLGWRVASRLAIDEDFWYRLWLEAHGETIYAGSSQIQRNIISERMLGLPR